MDQVMHQVVAEHIGRADALEVITQPCALHQNRNRRAQLQLTLQSLLHPSSKVAIMVATMKLVRQLLSSWVRSSTSSRNIYCTICAPRAPALSLCVASPSRGVRNPIRNFICTHRYALVCATVCAQHYCQNPDNLLALLCRSTRHRYVYILNLVYFASLLDWADPDILRPICTVNNLAGRTSSKLRNHSSLLWIYWSCISANTCFSMRQQRALIKYICRFHTDSVCYPLVYDNWLQDVPYISYLHIDNQHSMHTSRVFSCLSGFEM
jgi:hypothetical protein